MSLTAPKSLLGHEKLLAKEWNLGQCFSAVSMATFANADGKLGFVLPRAILSGNRDMEV